MNRFFASDAGNELRWTGPAVLLIAVNCIPLLGAIFWGWTLFEVVVLYWFENVVIGAVNVLKMVTCAPDAEHLKRVSENRQTPEREVDVAAGVETSTAGNHVAKLFLVPFFTFHYGMFCLVHGVFVFALLGGGGVLGAGGPFFMFQRMVADVLGGGLLLAAMALIGSHLYSYVFHFLGRGELRRTNVGLLFFAPYGRIVVLHLAILGGAFAIFFLGQPLVLVALLIIGKTLLDWQLHVRSHDQAEAVPTSGQTAP